MICKLPGARVAAVVAGAVLLAGCPSKKDEAAQAPARIDTTNAEWEDGLSSQQVQSEAEALSPEEAAAKGFPVDTSIHLEQLDPRDSALVEQGRMSAPARRDTVAIPVDTASP